MLASRLVALLGVAATLAACSGFSIGVRQDTEDQGAFARALGTQKVGSRFPARELLAKDWTRLFVFRGGIATQAIEDRIAIPFPRSGEATPSGRSYLVFADEELVVAAFSHAGPPAVGPPCLIAERVPLTPATPLTLLDAGSAGGPGTSRLSTVAGAARCR